MRVSVSLKITGWLSAAFMLNCCLLSVDTVSVDGGCCLSQLEVKT